MSKEITIEKTKLSPTITEQARAGILAFEERLKSCPEAVIGDSDICPLNHDFCDGLYVRDMQIPAGMRIVGKIHKKDHLVILLQGEILVATEEGVVHLTAPQYFTSPPGVKRAALTLTETVWVTVHHNPTNTRDLAKLEKQLIAKDFDSFDRDFKIQNTKNPFKKGFLILKKYLKA